MCDVRSVCVWYGHATVAIRKATALHPQNPRMSVRETQNRDLKLLRANKQLLKSWREQYCCDKNCNWSRKKTKCGLCGVGVFSGGTTGCEYHKSTAKTNR